MSYSAQNPPAKVAGSIGDGSETWTYVSSDHYSVVTQPGYFLNGSELGMAVDDVIHVISTVYLTATLHSVTTIESDGSVSISLPMNGDGGQFMLEISKGNIPGHSHVNKFGRNTAIGSGDTDEIWDGADVYSFPATALMTDGADK